MARIIRRHRRNRTWHKYRLANRHVSLSTQTALFLGNDATFGGACLCTGFCTAWDFDYTGVISTYLREAWGLNNGLPNIRHGGGLALVMSLTLYPYVYLLSKNAFSSMGNRALEVGASLGLSNRQSFFKIALPMARPWIASGIILALMEVLADFGAVSIFGYDTFTTAIYQAWYGFLALKPPSN